MSFHVVDSRSSLNEAIGCGADPQRPGMPGGGDGGALDQDGNRFTLRLEGSLVEDDRAREGGGGVLFVGNDRTGSMTILGSTLRRNPSEGVETQGRPRIFFVGAGWDVRESSIG